MMALVSERSLSLNPNAPLFIPFALQNVEDFSPKWWELVKTSPWFRDYWLSEHQEDDFNSNIDDNDITDALLESFDLDAAEEFDYLEPKFDYLEREFEEMILSTEAGEKYKPVTIAHEDAIKSSERDAKKVLKDLVISKSPRKKGPKSPAGLAKYSEKPAKCMSPKCTPRFIHQPR